MRNTFAIALAAVAACLAVSFTPPAADSNETKYRVRVVAPHAICNRIDAWGRTFMDEQPDYTVVVVGMSTNKALERLLDGTTDLCLTDTPMSEDAKRGALDKGMRLEERLLLHDGIAVIAHPRLPIAELSLEQLGKIYGGDYRNWSQVGGPAMLITAFAGDSDSSSSAAIVQEQILERARLAHATKIVRNSRTLIEIVSQNEGAIGYLSYRYLIEDRGPNPRVVKMLRIKKDSNHEGVAPNAQAINSGSYPLVRPVYLYWDRTSTRDWLKRFVDFLNPSLM